MLLIIKETTENETLEILEVAAIPKKGDEIISSKDLTNGYCIYESILVPKHGDVPEYVICYGYEKKIPYKYNDLKISDVDLEITNYLNPPRTEQEKENAEYVRKMNLGC